MDCPTKLKPGQDIVLFNFLSLLAPLRMISAMAARPWRGAEDLRQKSQTTADFSDNRT